MLIPNFMKNEQLIPKLKVEHMHKSIGCFPFHTQKRHWLHIYTKFNVVKHNNMEYENIITCHPGLQSYHRNPE